MNIASECGASVPLIEGNIALHLGRNVRQKMGQIMEQNWTDKYDIKALADECYPDVTIAAGDGPEPTHQQKTALFRKWKQDDQGKSWVRFARSAAIMMSNDRAVVVQWCGMWLCIELDGHCHT